MSYTQCMYAKGNQVPMARGSRVQHARLQCAAAATSAAARRGGAQHATAAAGPAAASAADPVASPTS